MASATGFEISIGRALQEQGEQLRLDMLAAGTRGDIAESQRLLHDLERVQKLFNGPAARAGVLEPRDPALAHQRIALALAPAAGPLLVGDRADDALREKLKERFSNLMTHIDELDTLRQKLKTDAEQLEQFDELARESLTRQLTQLEAALSKAGIDRGALLTGTWKPAKPEVSTPGGPTPTPSGPTPPPSVPTPPPSGQMPSDWLPTLPQIKSEWLLAPLTAIWSALRNNQPDQFAKSVEELNSTAEELEKEAEEDALELMTTKLAAAKNESKYRTQNQEERSALETLLKENNVQLSDDMKEANWPLNEKVANDFHVQFVSLMTLLSIYRDLLSLGSENDGRDFVWLSGKPGSARETFTNNNEPVVKWLTSVIDAVEMRYNIIFWSSSAGTNGISPLSNDQSDNLFDAVWLLAGLVFRTTKKTEILAQLKVLPPGGLGDILEVQLPARTTALTKFFTQYSSVTEYSSPDERFPEPRRMHALSAQIARSKPYLPTETGKGVPSRHFTWERKKFDLSPEILFVELLIRLVGFPVENTEALYTRYGFIEIERDILSTKTGKNDYLTEKKKLMLEGIPLYVEQLRILRRPKNSILSSIGLPYSDEEEIKALYVNVDEEKDVIFNFGADESFTVEDVGMHIGVDGSGWFRRITEGISAWFRSNVADWWTQKLRSFIPKEDLVEINSSKEEPRPMKEEGDEEPVLKEATVGRPIGTPTVPVSSALDDWQNWQ